MIAFMPNCLLGHSAWSSFSGVGRNPGRCVKRQFPLPCAPASLIIESGEITHVDEDDLRQLQATGPENIAMLKKRLAQLNARLGDDSDD